jgi:hypothetical protein
MAVSALYYLWSFFLFTGDLLLVITTKTLHETLTQSATSMSQAYDVYCQPSITVYQYFHLLHLILVAQFVKNSPASC